MPYNHKPTQYWRPYIDKPYTPLYPFGFGLSYSTYKYENLRLSKNEISNTESLIASVDVNNTSKIAGEEIVQFYLNDKIRSVKQPVKELKGFKRITLKAGEKQTVTFNIEPKMLKFYDRKMNWSSEPGEFLVLIGKSSDDKDLKKISFQLK